MQLMLMSAVVVMATSSIMPSSFVLAQSQGSNAAPSGYAYEGCYIDKGNPRSMVFLGYQGPLNTIQQCTKTCSDLGYPYSGSEYAGECYCDNRITFDKALKVNAIAPVSLSVYGVSPKVQIQYFLPNTSSIQYVGCAENPLPTRILNVRVSFSNSSMTIPRCTQECKDGGFTYAGLEYGKECWCGYTNPTIIKPDTDCFMKCSGNLTQTCGAPARLSVYKIATSAACQSSSVLFSLTIVTISFITMFL
ncbi:WSC domain-containing protein [Chytridium lagenaria]|nr:WSC domain-containing protein [Chytridium lagenaria]